MAFIFRPYVWGSRVMNSAKLIWFLIQANLFCDRRVVDGGLWRVSCASPLMALTTSDLIMLLWVAWRARLWLNQCQRYDRMCKRERDEGTRNRERKTIIPNICSILHLQSLKPEPLHIATAQHPITWQIFVIATAPWQHRDVRGIASYGKPCGFKEHLLKVKHAILWSKWNYK